MSDTPRTDAMFRSYVSDPDDDGGYILKLNKEETEELFRRIGSIERNAYKLGAVANQLASALECADRLNSNADYWGNADGGQGTHRDHSKAALYEYQKFKS